MVFITSQDNSQIEHCKKIIRDFDIDWPVLFYGDGDRVPQTEWQCRGNPIAFLINPQGVIVGHAYGAKYTPNLIDAYEFLSKTPSFPPIGLSTFYDVGDETGGVLYLDLNNPTREEITVEIDYWFSDIQYDDEGTPIKYERFHPDPDGPEESFIVEFNDTSDVIVPVRIEAGIYEMVLRKIRIMYPGTAHLADGTGIWTQQRTNIKFGDREHSYEMF